MVKSISILGSTGSIGRQTFEVCKRLGIRVLALTGNRNTELLEHQARELVPEPLYIAVCDEDGAKRLREALSDTGIEIGSGEEGLIRAATIEGAEAVVTAVSGAVGLKPTLAAIDKGLRIALANKETLVCAGETVMARAREKGAEIIPVDSEHSAIFQSMGTQRRMLKKILLTASGGPFRGKTRAEMADIPPRMALKHPNWDMGAKITIDSATLMNKGLELIEAMHLFSVKPSEIEVIVHPESIIHSMAEFIDGSVIAQLGVPEMTLPIQYALTYPERAVSGVPALDLIAKGNLSFYAPDLEAFPCLRLAMDCAERGGTAPGIMSAANEIAVELFLKGKIGFNQIYECAASALDRIPVEDGKNLEIILESDARARRHVYEVFS